MSPAPFGQRLGAKLVQAATEARLRAKPHEATVDAAARAQATRALMEQFEGELAPTLAKMLERLSKIEDLPPELRAVVDAATRPGHQVDFLLQMVTFVSFVISLTFQAGQPLVEGTMHRLWADNPNRLLDPAQAAEAFTRDQLDYAEAEAMALAAGINQVTFAALVGTIRRRPEAGPLLDWLARGLLSESDVVERLGRAGFDAEAAELTVQARHAPPNIGEIWTLVNRGLLPEGEATEKLVTLGLSPEDAARVLALRAAFPSPSDLVRMAVREVFSPEIAERFGQFEDLPDEYVRLAQQAGLSEQFAEWFWAAHWDLPSATQGFEMFHRGIIDEADVTDLLRALDVMPFWRDRMVQLSYNIPGRIDLRRAYRMGVLDEAAVTRGYRALGYSPEDAEWLTRFTVEEKLESERDLTKSEIVQLFEAGTFTREQAAAMLVDMRYTAAEAAYILDLGEHRKETRRLERAISVVRARFLAFRIDQIEASGALDALGVPADRRDEELVTWRVEREVSAPRVPVGTLQRFLRKGFIDVERFVGEAKAIGYSDDEVAWYAFDTGVITPEGTPTGEGE